jgi:hypothetical protein
MFKFNEANKADNMAKAKAMLEALVEKIEPLQQMEVGLDFNGSERAMDMSIYTTFDTVEGLKTYAVHPAHLEVVEFIKSTTQMSKVVDYER